MASLRKRTRKDGSEYYAVLYRYDGKQTSTSFEDFGAASKFCDLVTKFGSANALETVGADSALSAITVEQWCEYYVDLLSRADRETKSQYRAYIRNDIAPVLGDLPLAALTQEHVARWVVGMREPDEAGWSPSAKTIRNKHGFLAGALNTAIPKHIQVNPCDETRLPVDQTREMTFLSREQFALLHGNFTEFWMPMVKFLVGTGCRWGEAAALRPGDVDRRAGTVRISRTWKHGTGGYRIGPPKTPKSKRTINVPTAVLDDLDYSHAFLFANRTGGPVRIHGFTRRVWAPAVERSWPSKDDNGNPITPELRPRIHDLRHTAASWMIQAGVPLPVVQSHLVSVEMRLQHAQDRRIQILFGHFSSFFRHVGLRPSIAFLRREVSHQASSGNDSTGIWVHIPWCTRFLADEHARSMSCLASSGRTSSRSARASGCATNRRTSSPTVRGYRLWVRGSDGGLGGDDARPTGIMPPSNASPVPRPAPGSRQFQSPTGNIVCHVRPTGAACEIQDHDYPVPASPPGCVEYGDRFGMDHGGAGQMACNMGSFFGQPLPTQAYDTPLSTGPITCEINEGTGVTCRDTTTGHFFRVSRQSYQLG